MKLGKSKKNTPGCLTNKAMAYIKSKPAMYGKPKMDGDPVKKEKLTERVKKETGTVTTSEAGAMRKAIKDLKEGGYTQPISRHTSPYSSPKETTEEWGKRKTKEYINKFGQGQYNVRRAESNLRHIREKGPAGRTQEEIKAYQGKIAKAKQRIANAKKAAKASKKK